MKNFKTVLLAAMLGLSAITSCPASASNAPGHQPPSYEPIQERQWITCKMDTPGAILTCSFLARAKDLASLNLMTTVPGIEGDKTVEIAFALPEYGTASGRFSDPKNGAGHAVILDTKAVTTLSGNEVHAQFNTFFGKLKAGESVSFSQYVTFD